MYSDKIAPKVDTLFNGLKERANAIITDSPSYVEASNNIAEVTCSELAARSKSILSDMLFYLTDCLLSSESFADIAKQNAFIQINLRQEILDRYQFALGRTVDYKETPSTMNTLAVGGGTFVIGGAIEIGYVLIKELSFSTLVPIPIGILIAASISAALIDYHVIEPTRNERSLHAAADNYLDNARREFIGWLNEVERYYNGRVEEIELTI